MKLPSKKITKKNVLPEKIALKIFNPLKIADINYKDIKRLLVGYQGLKKA